VECSLKSETTGIIVSVYDTRFTAPGGLANAVQVSDF
jgi:hypothetical protein